MSRRRPSFATYARRRWRVVGLLLVLLAGSWLILAITDRGHDPEWTARGESTEQGVISPSGDAVYSLVRANGNITRLDAHRGSDGRLLWESPLNATRALLVAGDDGVAVATDFPRAFLTLFARDGAVRYQIPLEGVPHALVVDGPRVALSLVAPHNPVIVYDEAGRVAHVHTFGGLVAAIDMRGGRLAAGTGGGDVRIADAADGKILYNASLAISVRTLRLSADGIGLIVGGGSLSGDLTGVASYIDLLSDDPLRWSRETSTAVGFVDLDRSGVWAIAVEESPPRDILHAYEAFTGQERWGRVITGGLAQGDAGSGGGVSLSPDGQSVAVGTLHGGLTLYRMNDGEDLWSYHDEGTTLVTFARDSPSIILANGRLNAANEEPGIFLFGVAHEPFAGRLGALALIVFTVLLAAGTAVLGFGYWRVRRSY